MARSNGPFGPPETRPPLRRSAGDDTLAPLPVPQSQWPTQGFPDRSHAAPAGPAYHFPPPEPVANYGYAQQAYPPQQWGQQGDQQGYNLANYLPADPPPFQHTSHHQQQAYGDADADYADEYYEDDEPPRGRRWILIAAALVGAIGVGGALAYTYRSFVAPNTGRVPLVKAEPNVKVRPEHRGGKEFPGSDRKMPNRLGEGTREPEAREGPAGEEKNMGPRPVKTIPIGSKPAEATPPPPVRVVVPGITLQNLPPPQAEASPQSPPKAEEAPPRVAIGRPPAPEAEAEPASPPPPVKRAPVVQSPPPAVARAAPPKAREAPPGPPSSGVGYVAVVSSQKTHIDAVKAYADAVEKHPQVLSGRTPDVQEADLGEKGIWYRAVVGPPGSREAAMSLCSQLKAAGHGCWVKAY